MKLTSSLTAIALLAATTSASASVIQHRRQLGGITNGGVPDTTIISIVVPTGELTTIFDDPTATVTVQPPTPTTTIIDIFPTGDVCASAKTQRLYQGLVNDPVCGFLIDDCTSQVASRNVPLWSVNSCALAATCDGTTNLLQLAACAQPSLSGIVASQLPSLDYNIYAGIVGDCAWQQGGCPMTRQNFIDWFYRTLDEMGTPVWPDVNNVINHWWMPIRSWTATDPMSYLNFNDWLHWSNS